jgi:hypothetical protein
MLTMVRKGTYILLALAAFAQGCGAGGASDPLDEAGAPPAGPGLGAQADTGNGVSMNGVSMNGVSMNGVSMNGVSMNGVSMNGVSMNGVSMNGVSMNGSALNGVSMNGVSMNGAEMLGTVWTGHLSNGDDAELRLDAMEQLPAPNDDVTAYAVSYRTAEGWSPLCGLDATQQPVLAIPVEGVWNYGRGVPGGGGYAPDPAAFTFACRGATIAKCVEMGYKPWRTVAATGASLRDHLAACTRALRADYCGDGQSHTVNGTTINIYDGVGVQGDTEAWSVEAEWTPAGARFVKPAGAFRYLLAGQPVPWCFEQLASPDAGAPAHFESGTLLMNEY